jgi:hypothetical protein
VIPRFVASLLLVGAIVSVACIDMSAPKGPAAISDLKLPSPSVILGDTMRDSIGHAAPLRVVSYNADGLPIEAAGTELFVIDSNPKAHIGPLGFLIGDSSNVPGTVRVLGQVNQLQTPVVSIPVTFRPKTIKLGTTPDTFVVPLTGDTSKRVGTQLPVTVFGDTGSATALPPSQGIIVQFALLSAPPSIDPAAPAVFIGDPSSGKAMNLDTSDASGNANHRQLVVVPARLASVTGSATVNVTASYAGTLLSGSNLHFVIPIKASITATSVAPAFRRSMPSDILAPLRSQRGTRWARAVDPGIPHPER